MTILATGKSSNNIRHGFKTVWKDVIEAASHWEFPW